MKKYFSISCDEERSRRNPVLFSARQANICLVVGLIVLTACSSTFAWINPNFTSGLVGWTASTSTAGGWVGAGCNPPSMTVVNSTTMSAFGPGVAPNTDGLLPDHPACSKDAVQLYSSRGDSNNLDWAQIEQSDIVPTNGNTCLNFWFAGVFDSHHYDTGDTAPHADSYFEIDILVGGAVVASIVYSWENNLAQIVQLTNAQVTATGDGTECVVGTPNRWGYLPWTQYTINLCQYAGEQVTFRATDYDCDEGGHYGFGYLSCLAWGTCPVASETFSKSNSPNGQVSQGTTITYTLTYTNTGSVGAPNVTVTDTVPANTTFVPNSVTSSPPTGTAAQSGSLLEWLLGYEPPGASVTLSFQVVAGQACETVSNQAVETDAMQPCH